MVINKGFIIIIGIGSVEDRVEKGELNLRSAMLA
jgi:hypothetical protein